MAAFVLLAVFTQGAGAQNLVVNAGFENNPPPNFGNNIGYSISPWTLGSGETSNVVKVDGGSTFNYGTSGPALDADPATGVGVSQHYLDIASGSNTFYQAFTVPVCGGQTGNREVSFSGWFSTRDNLAGAGSIGIRAGAGLGGADLGSVSVSLSAPVSPATSGNSPWVKVSGTAIVTIGSTFSFVISLNNNLNFDEASVSFTVGTCVTSPLTLRKTWAGASVNDTASVRVSRGATTIDTLASTANTPNETDADATPATVFAGEQVTLAETLGISNAGTYAAALACTGDATLSGSTLTIGSSGGAITCTYTNSSGPTSLLTLRKTWIGASVNDAASVRVSRGATTIDTLASTANTSDETDTDITPVTVFAGEQVTLAETLGGVFSPNVGTYAATLECTGNASLSGSTLTIGSSGGPITCTYTNRRTSPLTLRKTWIGASVNDTASVSVSRGTTTIDALASTANTSDETDTDTTPVTVFAGEQVTLAETLGGVFSPNVGTYAATLACTGNASLSGSTLTIGSSGGPITCTYTNSQTLSADLGITKSNGTTTVTSGASTTYTVVVTNNGPNPVTGAVVSDTPTAGLTCPPTNPVTCAPAANCPVGALTIANLTPSGLSPGVTMPMLANGASATFTFSCSVQ